MFESGFCRIERSTLAAPSDLSFFVFAKIYLKKKKKRFLKRFFMVRVVLIGFDLFFFAFVLLLQLRLSFFNGLSWIAHYGTRLLTCLGPRPDVIVFIEKNKENPYVPSNLG